MELQFLGHACFLLNDGKTQVLIDPFLTGNTLAAASAEEVAPHMIFVTHGHSDHVGDAIAIAKRTGATVYCTVDLGDAIFTPAGISTVTGNLGGWLKTPFGRVKFVSAVHGSGAPGCLCCGFLFEIGGKKVYHAGDTALTMDMELLRGEHIDVALLPIGDVFTMGPEDALQAVQMIHPVLTIPMHYNTMPPIVQNPDAFVQSVNQISGLAARVMAPGEKLTL